MNIWLPRFYVVAGLLAAGLACVARAETTPVYQRLDISPWLSVLEDHDGVMDYETASAADLQYAYRPLPKNESSLRSTVYWLRFDPRQLRATEDRYVLYIPYRPLDALTLYLKEDVLERYIGNKTLIGEQHHKKRFASEYNLTWWEDPAGRITAELQYGLLEKARFRNGSHIHYRFWINRKYLDQAQALYLRVDNRYQPASGLIPVYLYDTTHYLQANLQLHLVASAYYSVMLCLCLFAFLIFIRVQEKFLLYYSVYLLLTLLLSTYVDGVWFSVLDPDAGETTLYTFRALWMLHGLLYLFFCFSIFSRETLPAALRHGRNLLGLAMLLLLCASFVLPWNLVTNSVYLAQTAMVSLVCLGLAFYASLQGYAYARSLLLMGVIHITLHGAYVLSLAGWISDSVISPWLVHLSCLVEALLLSMLLASQFILVRSRASDAEEKHRMAAAEAELEKKTHLEKSRFLAQASHDLRQPLHSLSLLATTLQIKTRQPDQKQLIDDMQKSIRSMNAMFADMLDLSRIDTGIIAPKQQAFFIHDILQELARECRPAATQKNLVLRVQAQTNWQVWSDPALLKRILRNLLVNAIYYTPSGSVMMGCRYRGKQLRIDVLDSGAGIDVSQLQGIFDEFVRGDGAQHHEGLGLGLAIVKRLANSMDHPVAVASCPGQGSRFSVSVPLIQQTAVVSREGRASAPLAESSVLQGRVMAIMDDDESVRHSLTVLLQALGGIVIAGADAAEIIHVLKQTEELPELLIVDYSLAQGKRGPEEAVKICAYLGDPGIPLLVITGDTSSHTLLALHEKPWLVLNKPVDPELLLQWIFQKLL